MSLNVRPINAALCEIQDTRQETGSHSGIVSVRETLYQCWAGMASQTKQERQPLTQRILPTKGPLECHQHRQLVLLAHPEGLQPYHAPVFARALILEIVQVLIQ